MIKVIVKKVDMAPEVQEVPNTLDTMREIVGGFIEMVPYWYKDSGRSGIVMLCNEDGIPLNLSVNALGIRGNMVICRSNGQEWQSLTDEEIEEVLTEIEE